MPFGDDEFDPLDELERGDTAAREAASLETKAVCECDVGDVFGGVGTPPDDPGPDPVDVPFPEDPTTVDAAPTRLNLDLDLF